MTRQLGWRGRAVYFLLALTLIAALGLSCGGEDDDESVVITVGYITDLTGPGSPAVVNLLWGLQDMVKYYNEENLIPGVKLKVVIWDTKYDTSREIPGYEWVRERGADLLIVVMPQSGPILMDLAEQDRVAIVSLSTHKDTLDPPGWVFNMSNSADMHVKTLLKWISEEHWEGQGIPKLGLVGWSENMIVAIDQAMEEYIQDNPGQFEYGGPLVTPFGSVGWASEVEQLKEADYIAAIGFPMGNIMKEYQARGYSATFIDPSSGASSYHGFLVDMLGYEGLDGTLTSNSAPYWSDDSPVVTLAKDLLDRYRPGQKEDTIYKGLAYVGGIGNLVNAFAILKNAIDEVGAENFSGQAYYDQAVKYEAEGPLWVGYPEMGFTETQRYLVNHLIVSEFDADVETLVNLSGWLLLITD